MMNYLLTAALIICTICGQTTAFQSNNPSLVKQNEPPARIESPLKIWGNYLMSAENISFLEKQEMSKAQIQDIIAFSHQSTWSLALQHILESPDFPHNFPPYHSTFLATISEEPILYLYKIAAADNQHLPDSLLLENQDFYIVVKE